MAICTEVKSSVLLGLDRPLGARPMSRRVSRLFGPLILCGVVGCAASSDDDAKSEDDFSSDQATQLDFEFDGQLETSASAFGGADALIKDQLLYTIGHLNGSRAVGRLDRLVLSNVQQQALGGGRRKISYRARLPVSWGSKSNLPTTYDFTLAERRELRWPGSLYGEVQGGMRRTRRARRRCRQHVVLLPASRVHHRRG